MPEISRFLGIVIYMYFKDHNPPHLHVVYEKYEASIEIKDLKIIKGSLPPRILGFVVEWAMIHQDELLENWEAVKYLKTPKKIEPLIS
jgi:hypothetical protein